ncbi:MAG: type I methionyl aminopeptidase [Pseudomonadota bacterium]
MEPNLRKDVDRTPDGIKLHAPEDFAGMRAAGALAARILDEIAPHVAPGVKTGELDEIIHEKIIEAGATPATLGYRGYTKSSCISINHVVCHGIPGNPVPKTKSETISRDLEKRRDDDRLLTGDVLNIDVTVILDGWFGDTSRMYVAGKPKGPASRLIDITHEALMRGISVVRPGARFGDIGHAIQSYVEGERCSVVRDFCGHGLGRVFHDSPSVVHYGRLGTGPEMRPGMFFTIEPMVNLGRPETKILDDGWTAVTRDKSLSAQFEHSVGVTEDGVEIFTLSPSGRFHPTWDR